MQLALARPSGISTARWGTCVWRRDRALPAGARFICGAGEAAGDGSVGMNWLTPRHLELTYKGDRSIDFQAVKWRGIDISLRKLPSETAADPSPLKPPDNAPSNGVGPLQFNGRDKD